MIDFTIPHQVIQGDMLDVLAEIPNGCAASIVTDPPYGINTKSDGQGKLNPWADLTNSAYWYAEWFRRCRKTLSFSGSMWVCLNWRSLVTFQKASFDVEWPIESLMVWDKKWIGPGGSRGLRPSYELVALFCQPDFSVDDRGLPDIQPFPWSSQKPHGHPAEKPETLMRFCVENGTQPGDLVIDPFCGSGTTGAACLATGRRFLGIESDPKWAEVARRRIAEAAPLFVRPQTPDPELFTPKP